MRKVGTLKRLVVALSATTVVLVIAAVSGAAPGTEASVTTFDQCANGGPPSTSTGCPENWINGILNANNSHYAEDDVTPQRVILELPKNSPATGRTVEITYLTRKGGVHAYDSLATWNHTQTSADRCANLPAADCVPGSASTLPVPSDPTVVADNDGSGSATSGHQLAGQVFTLYGGTLTGASSYTHDDASGTSDSFAHITLTYSVPSTADGAKVMLLFGGHIAPGLGPRGWGAGVGAGSISGGPYHVRITGADGASVGNRDNQIMSGAILSPANIVIRKNTVGGDATFNYAATGGISSSFSITTSSGTASQSFTNITAGSYTVTESAPLPAGWDFTNLVCVDEDSGSSVDLALRKATIDLDPGETVTCTYTNTKRGQIFVDKVTAPSGDPQSFPFTLTGGPDGINQGFNLADATTPHDSGLVKPGTYAAAETSVPAGWDLASSTCSDGSAPGSIALEAGETVTCTFTNTRKAALTVIKHVVNDNGGSKTASQFPIQVSGSSPNPASFAGAEVPGTSVAIGAGTYNVSETEDPGYTASYSAGCSGNIPAGGSATCTITNDDRPATLTVIKHVVNDNGGTALASAFTMTINGVTAQGGNSFPGAEAPGVTKTLTSAGAYNVSESSLPGYTQTSASADCSGTIALGESKTCTITNDDVAARLIVIKTVVNDNGGQASSSNWTMNVAGPTNLSFTGEAVPGTNSPVNPGAYKVTESGGPAGYALSYSGDCDADGDVTVPLGQTMTCVLTNNDQQATITVIKNVINDNGGTALASAFTMSISGVTAQGGNSFPGAPAPGVVRTITTFGNYNVTEGAVAGYTQTSASADCAGTIALGQHRTCTITNDDLAPTLTLVKQVVNDSGGSALPSAWTLTAAGPTGFSGAGPSVSSGASFDSGSYNLSEAGPVGYAASNWVCTGGQLDGDTVSVGLDDDITCTITNNDRPASLTVIKHVVNDNGGTAAASDFAMTINGVSAGGGNSFPGAEAPGVTKTLTSVGSYDVSESSVPGYSQTSASAGCAGTIALGESKTCTITNDDQAPKLTLVKAVVNDHGGTALPSAWDLAAAGPTGFSGPGPSVSSGAGFDAGIYNLSESGGPAGYDASAWDCTGESQADDDTVSVGLGDDITCTITNNDKPATLIVKKVVVNDNGGTKVASDFSFQVNGGAAQSFEADGQNNLTVGAGTYDVTEPGVAGYTTTYQGCADIVLLLGGTATCTVTNNDVPRGQGSIDVQKSANPTTVKEPGGQVAYSVRITNTSADVDVHITNVVDDKFGDLDDDGGNGCFDVPINLAPGQSASCQFTKQVTGAGGTTHVNTVTASGTDENGNPVSDSDDARVNITERLIDLVIVKDASSPTPLNGIVNYSLTVTNKGPDTATNVQLADPAPAGITYLTANPSQGTCNVSASLITCSLGSIAAGQTVTIAITGRATTVGSHTNTATVTGGGGRETNPADNVDSAVTIVPAPLRPPTVKPSPAPAVCLSLTVSPKMIKADGKPDKVTAKVTAGKKRVKGVTVVVRGAGVSKAAKTNGNGVAVLRINAKKPGLITVTVAETNQKLCGPKRIGVVGVFLPPLTG